MENENRKRTIKTVLQCHSKIKYSTIMQFINLIAMIWWRYIDGLFYLGT